ncbi:uncharacterized protein LOC123700553 isoform X2 [Colias croceus]|uniref:uncharacterized protein LOC123700553 isoform X2 n=1 Tax=Colias crocea TaxID=72248 RepID=UPI001E27BFB5|nr:uncharacterized protein LOC123700553 isoform X2 [Colias croceus]
MDPYAHYEAYDFLDYLIPPVKKNYNVDRDSLLLFERYSYKKYPCFPISKQHLKRLTFRNKTNTKPGSSASYKSLFLKKSSERLLQEQCSILDVIQLKRLERNKSIHSTHSRRCNRLSNKEEKPVIQITVIPKSVKTQTSKVFNKRILKKEISKTVSNQDNSTKNKNVYVVVSGRKREKVYELKTSESENFSNRWRHPIKHKFPVKQSSKQVLDSMDMERNSLRGKKIKDGKLFRNQGNFKQKPSGQDNIHKERKPSKLNLTSPKSRVTIFGQLGRTDNDQYVLNCAATVNNKPIPTNVTHLNDGFSFRNNPDYINMNQFSNYTSSKKYSVWNANLENDANANERAESFHDTSNLRNKQFPRMESQGIQVNLCVSKSKTGTKYMKDQYIQCMCQNTDKNKSDDENENILNQNQSPIVVISVYPKFENGDTNLGHTVKIEQRHAPSPKHALYNEMQMGTSKKTEERNFISRERFRSKSPISAISQGKSDIYKKTDGYRLTSPNRSPNYSPNLTRKFNNEVNKKTYSKHDFRYEKSKFKNGNRPMPTKMPHSNETRSETETLNASRNLAKKALVDSYISKLDSEEGFKTITRKNFLVPKDDASKVTINIDGETEQYDLLFEQNKQNTNLSVRKTIKEANNKNKTDMRDTASLKHLFDLSQEILPGAHSVSQVRKKSPINLKSDLRSSDLSNAPKLNKRSSKLCVRDSIEISHRRGSLSSGGNPKPAKSKNSKEPSNSTQSSNSKAHAKHYRGDNCFITDPTERDKEIRELLGILTGRKCDAKTNSKQRIEDIFPVYKHCEGACCQEGRNSDKKLMTGISLSKLPASNCMQKFFKKIKNVKVEKPSECENNKPVGKAALPDLEDERWNIDSPAKVEEQQDLQHSKDTGCKCFHNPAQRIQNEMQNEEYSTHNKFPNNNQHNVPIEPKKPLMCPHCKEPRNPIILNKPPINNSEQTNDASLILNRNIQIFLEVEQFKKQRPIILTKKQYDKVKKTIQSTISKKTSNEKRRSAYYNNFSIVSIGDVKVRSKCQEPRCINKEVQTESFGSNRICSEFLSSLESFERHEASLLSHSMFSFDKNQEIRCQPDIDEDPNNSKIVNQHPQTSNAMSSLEVRYASVAFSKHVTYSSPLGSRGLESSLFSSSAPNYSNSLHTIFKGFPNTIIYV